MGKASRRKRERRGNAQARASALTLIPRARLPGGWRGTDFSGQVVYRFFKDAEHADAMASGKIWISTLETCRQYENPLQGDPEEATQKYNSGHAIGGSGDRDFKLIAARSGIHIGDGCSNISISNCTSMHRVLDAYVLCTTSHFDPDKLGDVFGLHCVEVTHPHEFFRLMSLELAKLHKVREAAYGSVIYSEREYKGLEDPPGPIGFVKPPDKYQDQREVRFLWTVDEVLRLQPFLLDVPNAATLCRRLSPQRHLP